MKNNLNLNRTIQSKKSSNFYLNIPLLIGFIEGDGTLGIKKGLPYFKISQKDF